MLCESIEVSGAPEEPVKQENRCTGGSHGILSACKLLQMQGSVSKPARLRVVGTDHTQRTPCPEQQMHTINTPHSFPHECLSSNTDVYV
jgi:hypothetical protein